MTARRLTTPGCALLMLGCAFGSSACRVEYDHHDTLLRIERETVPLAPPVFRGEAKVLGAGDGPRFVEVHAVSERACDEVETKVVDRTTYANRQTEAPHSRVRIVGYASGGTGAALATSNLVVLTQTDDDDLQTGAAIAFVVGTIVSAQLITAIVLEFATIDTKEHVGVVREAQSTLAICEREVAAGLPVELRDPNDSVVTRGELDAQGRARLPLPASAHETTPPLMEVRVDAMAIDFVDPSQTHTVVAAPPEAEVPETEVPEAAVPEAASE